MADDYLYQRILKLGLRNADDRLFIPEAALNREIFGSEARGDILTAIRGSGVEFHMEDEVLNSIMQGGKKVFAILVLINSVHYLRSFIERDGFQGPGWDGRLPFLQESHVESIIDCPRSSASFYETQWVFLAPVFGGDRSHRQLHDRVVLPFIKDEYLAEGGFGKISKVSLPRDYQELGAGYGDGFEVPHTSQFFQHHFPACCR
jgi:hypothetical protein